MKKVIKIYLYCIFQGISFAILIKMTILKSSDSDAIRLYQNFPIIKIKK